MKKCISIFSFLMFLNLMFSQGKNLVYSRVIDTVLRVDVTTCTDLYSNPQYSSPLIVPAGRVWKITSSNYNKGASYYIDPSYTYLVTNNCQSTSQQNTFRSTLYKTSVSGETPILGDETSSLYPKWFNSNTEFKLKCYSLTSTYAYTRDVYLPYWGEIHLSILEFLEVTIE